MCVPYTRRSLVTSDWYVAICMNHMGMLSDMKYCSAVL